MNTRILSILAAAFLPGLALAHDPAPEPQARLGDLSVQGAFLRATPARAPVAGGYLAITNDGADDDRLVAVTAPIGERVEIHEMAEEDGVMVMREIEGGVPLPAGETTRLQPGGLHLMVLGLDQQLAEGETVEMVLTFEQAGDLSLPFDVLAINARHHPDMPAGDGDAGHDHQH